MYEKNHKQHRNCSYGHENVYKCEWWNFVCLMTILPLYGLPIGQRKKRA